MSASNLKRVKIDSLYPVFRINYSGSHMKYLKDKVRLFLLILILLFSQPLIFNADAFQADRVQHGNVKLDSNALTADCNLIYPIDPGKSFLTLNFKIDSIDVNAASQLIAAYFLDRHTVRIIREQSGASLEVSISVVEFKNGVKVTHGVTQFSKDVFQKRIAVAKLQNKSAASLIMTTAPAYSIEDGAYLYFTSFFSDSSTFSIKRSEGAEIKSEGNKAEVVSTEETGKKKSKRKDKNVPRLPIPEATVYWQIIEFLDGVKVSQGSAKLSNSAKDTNSYLTEPVKHINHAFIFFNWLAGQMTHGRSVFTSLNANFSDDSVLNFSRSEKGSERLQDLEVQWSVFELQSAASLVQNGTLKFEVNEFEKKITIKSIFPERSLVLMTSSGGSSGQIIPEAQQTASLKFLGEIVGHETLLVSRGQGESSAIPAEVNWSVIQFAPLSLRSPRGGELWFVGENREITWDYSGDMMRRGKGPKGVQQINILLSLDGGADGYPYVIAKKVLIDSDHFNWFIPDEVNDQSIMSKNLKIKIETSNELDSYFDVSAEPFEIKGVLQLVAPQGGEVWYAGETFHKINWKYKGRLGVLSIYYDTESGYGSNPFPKNQRIARVVPGKNGAGSLIWNPIPDISSTRVRVRIVSELDKAVNSGMENDFSVIPMLKIISPGRGADPFEAEKYQMIKWSSSGTIKALNLYFRTSETSNWVLAAKDIPGGEAGLKSYRWFVPPEAVSEALQIKLEKSGDPDVFDWAPGNGKGCFTVRSWIIFNEPAQAATWRVGEKRKIAWAYGGAPQYLSFEYSIDGGTSWIKEVAVKAADKKFTWTVADAASEQFKIRLVDVKNSETYAVSDQNIRIISQADVQPSTESGHSDWWVQEQKKKKPKLK